MLNSFKINLLNFLYVIRMFKDKTYQSVINWYYKEHFNVDRIYNESGTVYNHFKKLSMSMTPIIDNIYLGNACDASFYYKLKNESIGLIINVTKEIPNYFEEDFEYYNIKINDVNSETFTDKTFEDTLTKIEEYQNTHPDKKILIHCYMGSSRSATIVLAYLMKIHAMTLQESLKLLKKKRSIVNVNTSFYTNLKEIE